MSALHELTALEQAAAVARREIKPSELVEHYLRRIEAYDAPLGAFVTVTADRAMAAARAAEVAVTTATGASLPLHGVPIAIKDLAFTAGVRTTMGSAAFADFIPEQDADVVAALRAAGTISLGKTTTSEFGCSCHGEGLVAPAARNPYQREMSAGGSSAGAAVAVAAGLVAVAHGSDGGGSLRIPAAICAVVGVKPSRGVIPGGPFGFGGFGLPTNGPIARTVADAAAMLDAMAVPGLGEPYPAPPLPPGGHLAAIRRPLRRLRVGWFVTPMLAEVDVDPACRAAVQMAAEALAEAGHDLREIAAPVTPDVAGWFETVWSALSLAPVPPDREDRLLPLTRYLRERGRAAGTSGLLAALGALQGVVRSAQRALHDVDVLLCPTLARPQVPVGWFTARGDPAWDFEEQKRFSPYCAIINLLGGPAASVPCGASAAMISGAWGSDATVLAVAAELEQRLPWSARHPPQWAPVGSVTVDRSHGSP